MKKSTVKNVISAAAAAACVSLISVPAFASAEPQPISGIAAPQNIVIIKNRQSFSIDAGGKTTCYGLTNVPSGYDAETIVELQQLTGTWNTIKSWRSRKALSAVVDENWYVTQGFSYRIKVTHKAYNSSGTLIESIPEYSKAVTY